VFDLVWKNVPKDEHWISFDVEIFHVDPWTPKTQFDFMDLNQDQFLTEDEVGIPIYWKYLTKNRSIIFQLVKFNKKMHQDFGKSWPNEDIDDVIAARYFLNYFDQNNNGKITFDEYETKMKQDIAKSKGLPKPKVCFCTYLIFIP